eukprot:1831164-Rhodomonas_salina.1
MSGADLRVARQLDPKNEEAKASMQMLQVLPHVHTPPLPHVHTPTLPHSPIPHSPIHRLPHSHSFVR